MSTNGRWRQAVGAAMSVLLATVAGASASVAPAAAAPIPGVQRYKATSAFNTAATKSATAACPAGQQVVGTSFTINVAAGAGEQHVLLESLLVTGSTVKATATKDQLSAALRDWSVTAVAHCDDPPPGYQIVVAPSAADSAAEKVAVAYCPAGKQVLGVGMSIVNGNGRIALDQLAPGFADWDRVFAKAFEAHEYDYTGNWTMNIQAICALPLGQRVVTSNGWKVRETYNTEGAYCSDDESVMSGAFDLVGSLGRVRFMGAYVYDPLAFDNSVHVAAGVGGYEPWGADEGWSVVAYAVCANR